MDSAVWADPNLWRTWCCCLLLANHAEGFFKVDGLAEPVLVKPGQFVTGRYEFHRHMFPKPKKSTPAAFTVWRWLGTLETLGNLCIKSCNKYSIVSITNWETYQTALDKDVQVNVPVTCSRRAAGVQQACTNKNVKNEKNVKKRSSTVPDSFTPNGRHRQFADDHNLDLEWQRQAFVDRSQAKGEAYRDFDRAFNNWLKKAVEFGNGGKPAEPPRRRRLLQ